MDKEIVLNGNKITETEFEQRKEEIEKQKGVKLVEVTKDQYRTLLQD